MAITPKIAWTIKLEWEFLQYILHGFSSLKNQIPCWVDLLRFQNHTLNSFIASMAIPPKKKKYSTRNILICKGIRNNAAHAL